MQKSTRFSDMMKNDEQETKNAQTEEAKGYYLLRKNYERIKPYSKYTEEGVRPPTPNKPYSFLSDELVKNNPKNMKNDDSVFRQTVIGNLDQVKYEPSKTRHYVDRYTETYSQHLIRNVSVHNPYCYISKDAFDHNPPEEYSSSRAGAYPTWGPDETGIRTRSHFVAEPVDRFANIDMYKRPPTNQPGTIIFDHGRPNNGYYLQRNQYNNTWFPSTLKLNKTDILKSIEPKTKQEYELMKETETSLLKTKTENWPFCSEYTDKFALKSST